MIATQVPPASSNENMTAALPKSFARLPSGLISKLSRSTAASMALFSSSTISTSTNDADQQDLLHQRNRQHQRDRGQQLPQA